MDEVLAFDLFGTLVDTASVAAALARALAGASALDAPRLAAAWRAKQLEYTFRLTLMEQYQDFDWVTARALEFALAAESRTLGPDERAELAAGYWHLSTFPDVADGLARLAGTGRELVVLSNGSPAMLAAYADRPEFAGRFTRWISVEDVRAYKPARRPYEYAAHLLGRPIGALRLISSNPFDVIGAKSAGLATAWIDRGTGVFDPIGAPPDMTVAGLTELAAVLGG
jgi:2-haloacid dehalogenase